ncbi:TPA: ABC transporter permease [Streptococcus suis]|uniref:ABC transporter permease n=1 Tax=Streptococcus suis TaxID=1307 RepID=UPI000CF6D63A|nr:ABC transporter permease [Streptococcus suis]
MLKSIAKILLKFIIILFCVSFISFLLSYLAPGDPAEAILNQEGVPVTQELLDLTREKLGLNDPFLTQYFRWLSKIVVFDFGVTYNTGAPVWDQLVFYFPNTLYLSMYILLATLLLSIPTALVMAYKKDSLFDRTLMSLLGILNAIPTFVFGIILILIFSVHLKWFPVQSTANSLGIVLPVVTLALAMSSVYTPQLRTAFLEELNMPFVEGARGRGISEWRIIIFDVLKNTVPFIITLVSLSLGALVSGVTIIEHLYSWPGMGKLLVTVVANQDYPIIQGTVLFVTVGVLTVNLVSQVLIAWLNPKIRLGNK